MAKLTFWGAAQEVTGSCHLIETEGLRILLDCGMHQGGRQAERRNGEPFPFNPRQLDAVILSHGHLDHSGLLPRLFKEGYKGPVYCTEATRNLLAIMLEDAAGLHLRDVEWENRRRKRAGKPEIEPWYDMDDVLHVLEHCKGVPYHETRSVNGHVKLYFRDAAHIIGSAIVELQLEEKGRHKKLVFSGDLGNPDAVLMKDPEIVTDADVVLMEGTYGDRDHRTMDNTLEELGEALQQASQDKGNHIIVSKVEHHSILNSARFLEKQGFVVTYLRVDKHGLVDPEEVRKAITDETILISIIHASPEIGTIQPIAEIGMIAKEKGIIFHTDAVVSAGNIPIDVEAMNVDLMTIAAHQFYGPKGAAALYVKQGVRIVPLIYGGIQEGGRRAAGSSRGSSQACRWRPQRHGGLLQFRRESGRAHPLRDTP